MLHDWAKLPADIAFGNTHGVAQDSTGLIYIKHTVGKGSRCADAIVVFDAEGKFITSWGKEFKGGAHGLQLVREGRDEFLLLADPNRHLVVKTTLNGKEVFRITFPEASDFYHGAGEFRPTNVAVAPDGDIYVADGYGKNYIHIYDRNGSYRKSFGGTGKEDGDRHPKIRQGVLIGAGAKILGNIEIGRCARIAAGSVVLKPVPNNTTVAGVPAKVVGQADCAEPSRSMDQLFNDLTG